MQEFLVSSVLPSDLLLPFGFGNMLSLSLDVESPDFAATSEVLCVGALTLVLLSFVSISFSIARYGWQSQLHTRKRSSLTELIALAGD